MTTKVEVEIPLQIWGFLKAAAEFMRMDVDEYVQEFIVEAVLVTVKQGVNQIGNNNFLLDENSLVSEYGLYEVKSWTGEEV